MPIFKPKSSGGVEAIQLTADNVAAVRAWYLLNTPGGKVINFAAPGDYLVMDPASAGGLFPVPPEVFNLLFAEGTATDAADTETDAAADHEDAD